ncbi:hypothetical protein UlMin_000933 [Ulmus minor]
MANRPLFAIFVLVNLMVLFSASSAENVTVSLYYETLCPYCADFIVNHLAKIFQNGLISIVNLRLVPWGNAWINSDNGTVTCQHGPDECLLNTIEACTITIYPDVTRHFTFIHCVEGLTLAGRHNEWPNCFEMSRLGRVPVDCYTSGYGKVIEDKYAKETANLNPPHGFVPWVVVNNHALREDFQKFMVYICKAYRGNHKPNACESISSSSEIEPSEKANSGLASSVCYAGERRNFASLALEEKIPR